MTSRKPPNLSEIRPTEALDRGSSFDPSLSQRAAQPNGPSRSGRRRRQLGASRPRRKRWSWLARIAAAFVVFFLIAGSAIGGFLVYYSPVELVRAELVRQVKANTGRDLRIGGGARFIFYPNIGVSVDQVQLSAPPGVDAPPTLTAERLDVSVQLIPLLSQNVRIDHIGLVRPIIDLRVTKTGRQSWDFALGRPATTPKPVRLALLGKISQPASVISGAEGLHLIASAPNKSDTSLLDALELRSVTLVDAMIRYQDDRTGASHSVEDLDMTLRGRRISDPMSAIGDLVWRNERLSYTIKLDTLRQLLAGQVTKLRFTANGQFASAGFDGTLKIGQKIELRGQTRLNGDSLVTTAHWLGTSLPNAGPLGGFQASGRLVLNGETISLNSASLSLGETRANGVVLVALRPKRPYISADLQVSDLDVDRLSLAFEGAKARTRGPSKRPARGPSTVDNSNAQETGKPQSIEDLLRRSQVFESPSKGAGRFAPQVRGYTSRNEWSGEAINLASLSLVDVKARLRINGLKAAGLTVGRAVARLALADASARVDIDDIQLYGGEGKGVVTARPVGSGLSIGANLRVSKISARPLLADAAGFERIDGRGDLAIVVSGTGPSQSAIANNLAGTANFTFQDGAIVGWNLAKIIRGLQQGRISGLDAAPTEKTDFSELAASFKIDRGQALTNDLKMVSPLLRLTGTGRVGIGQRDLDLALRPRLVTSLQGQGAGTGGDGLSIPIKLKGPWNGPRIVPDIKGLTGDPEALIDQAKKIGKSFKGKNIGDIVRGALGGRTEQGQQGASKPGDLLKQFWKQ